MFYFLVLLISSLSADCLLTSKIPLHIWQTDKTKELSIEAIANQSTWKDLNPEFSYFLFDDADIENYIREKWTADYLIFFHALPIGAMKADLWRYMIAATEGGVYSDIDSVCLFPIRDWPLKGYTKGEHVLLLSLDANHSQFCQWTFACTPNHPAMKCVCEQVLKQWKKKGIIIKEGLIDVIASTGPKIFTSAIKSYLKESHDMSASKILKKYMEEKEYRKKLNQLGIFIAEKNFFNGIAARNLFWGSWAKERANL